MSWFRGHPKTCPASLGGGGLWKEPKGGCVLGQRGAQAPSGSPGRVDGLAQLLLLLLLDPRTEEHLKRGMG